MGTIYPAKGTKEPARTLAAVTEGVPVGEWETARKAALDRDEGTCRRCWLPATDVHHRQVKGMGGTRNEKIAYGLPNLVSLCRDCHRHVHMNVAESYKQGWLVHSWDDPADIPLPDEGACAPIF